MAKRPSDIRRAQQADGEIEKESKTQFPLVRTNFILMAIAGLMIVLGFVLMAGGGSDDPNVFNEDMFSFRRITLAPIVVLAGFAFEIYAIMKKPRKEE